MRITKDHRQRLIYYLNEFYKKYPEEKSTIFHFVKYFKQRLKNNKDAWMSVSGETGSGKSLTVLMAMILFGRPMDLTKNVTYLPTGNEIIEKFNKLKFNCLLVDESAKDMRSVDWQKKSQKKVTTKAMTDRFMNNWIFLNIPNFNELTKSLKQTNITFRAIVIYRTNTYARIVIQRKSRNWRDDDAWGDKLANDIYKRSQKRYKEIDNDIILTIERRLPNHVMDFIVPNLELILPDVTDEYERLKLESRKKDDDDPKDEKKPNVFKQKYDNLLNIVTKLLVNNELGFGKVRVTKQEIASKLHISTSTLNKYEKMPPIDFYLKRGKEESKE